MLHPLRTLFVLICLLLSLFSKATHNRAGEITYKRIAPFTKVVGGTVVQVYTYSITIIKYSDHGSSVADRCLDTIYFGDGERGIAKRINGLISQTCCIGIGELGATAGSIIIPDAGFTVKLNTYTITHTYSGPGQYLLRSLDPNRNGGVRNIPNSINIPFYVESLLIINAFTGANSSPLFAFAPIDRACQGICFEHDPGAYDPDGDSLSYELTQSRGGGQFGSDPVPGYFYPSQEGGTYSINPTTGKLSWCVPNFIDEYNLAFVVKEWRKNTSGDYQLIGYVMRDMQVIVKNCGLNLPPSITVPNEICVEAGKTVTATMVVSDPNNGDFVTVEGGGGAFAASAPLPSFNPKSGSTFSTSGNSFNVLFIWNTNCDHIRSQSYYTTFKVSDQGSPPPKQVSFNTLKIKVVPPTVKNVTATPAGTSMKISWSATACSPINNPLVGYKVYRKGDCSPFIFDPCSSSIPATSDYVVVNDTATTNTFITDTNKGAGLVVGENYSYIVVAIYKDGTQTAGSAQVCAKLKRDVPVILNVDIDSTSTTGTVWLRWTKPLTTAGNFDTLIFPGPYTYNLKYRNGISGNFNTIQTYTSNLFLKVDTQFLHKDVNTNIPDHYYLVEFLTGTTSVGTSQNASSVFLSATPSDRKILLTWSSKTPWFNSKYTVMKKDPSSTSFSIIATTSLSSFADTTNVANEFTYCYYVTSEGSYSDTSILKPLINASQIVCAKAIDFTPPALATLTITGDCPSGRLIVTWNDVSALYKSDDLAEYILFYKPTVDATYQEIYRVLQGDARIYVQDNPDSYSGCYAMKTLDTNANLSALGPEFCVDNCPEFELPNIFSPNNDEANDFFKAIRVKQIKEIDLTILDRWGNVVYKTKDPFFKWDGISQVTKVAMSESTYFYVCDVYESRLVGIVKRSLNGTVQLVR